MSVALQVVPDVWLPDGTILRGLTGTQQPRFWTAPPRHRDKDPECAACANPDYPDNGCGNFQSADLLDWAPEFGYDLDPWQQWWLAELCGTRPDGRWASFENYLVVSRQNGKNQNLEVRELGGLFVFGEKMIIHTAHELPEFKAAAEHFRRVRDVVTAYDELRKRVKSVTTSHGDEAIELLPEPTLIFGSGGRLIRRKIAPRLRFLARSRGSGRSFTADCVVYDEAMILSDEVVGASLPTLSAIANPQVIYTASAGYKDSTQLGAVRRRVLRRDPKLMGAEWSINPHTDTCHRDEMAGRKANRFIVCALHDDRDDPRSWAKANPATGIRISLEHISNEMESLSASPHIFDRERLGVGDWPTEDESWLVVSREQWEGCALPDPGGATRPVVFAVDVDPDMISATIASAWYRPGENRSAERPVVEIPQGCHREGTSWVIPRLIELRRAWRPAAIIIPKNGPAAGFADAAVNAGLDVTWAASGDEAAAFSLIVNSIRAEPAQRLIHLGRELAPGLWQAVATAETRDVGDGGKAWSRRDSESDITPITAGSLALWALNKRRRNYDPLKSIR
jgi:hypothetical protein